MKRANRCAAAAMMVGIFLMACGGSRPASAPKQGEDLPAQIEGVERVGDTLRVKPGYGWTKQPDGTFSARKAGETGGGDIIRVGCHCTTGEYACEAVLRGEDTIKCETKGDCLSCKFYRPTVNDLK